MKKQNMIDLQDDYSYDIDDTIEYFVEDVDNEFQYDDDDMFEPYYMEDLEDDYGVIA